MLINIIVVVVLPFLFFFFILSPSNDGFIVIVQTLSYYLVFLDFFYNLKILIFLNSFLDLVVVTYE